MKTVTILRRARKLISARKHWTKHVYRERLDSATGECAYCAVGAIREAAPVADRYTAEHKALVALVRCLPEKADRDTPDNLSGGTITNWNDSPARKHKDVLKAFDCAIEAEDKGKS